MPSQDPKKAQEKIDNIKQQPQHTLIEVRQNQPRNIRDILNNALEQHFNNNNNRNNNNRR